LPRLDWQTILRGLAGFIAAVVIWTALSPLYDQLVVAGAEAALRTFENPKVTRLEASDTNVTVNRTDFDPRSPRPGLPVIDLTFNWVLLAALFAINARPFSDRNIIGFVIASAIMCVTHMLALAAEIQSIYVLRLGMWSRLHYGELARNFWGATNHAYRFVLMFAIAFALWWVFRGPATAPEKKISRSARKASRRRARS